MFSHNKPKAPNKILFREKRLDRGGHLRGEFVSHTNRQYIKAPVSNRRPRSSALSMVALVGDTRKVAAEELLDPPPPLHLARSPDRGLDYGCIGRA